eukprot:5837663-Prymnesium_polylepis.1
MSLRSCAPGESDSACEMAAMARSSSASAQPSSAHGSGRAWPVASRMPRRCVSRKAEAPPCATTIAFHCCYLEG